MFDSLTILFGFIGMIVVLIKGTISIVNAVHTAKNEIKEEIREEFSNKIRNKISSYDDHSIEPMRKTIAQHRVAINQILSKLKPKRKDLDIDLGETENG